MQAFHLVSPQYGVNMVRLGFGEAGQGSSLDMGFRVVASLVYMSTLRNNTLICW